MALSVLAEMVLALDLLKEPLTLVGEILTPTVLLSMLRERVLEVAEAETKLILVWINREIKIVINIVVRGIRIALLGVFRSAAARDLAPTARGDGPVGRGPEPELF